MPESSAATVVVREERAGDAAGVRDTIESAFGRSEEADLVDRLRARAVVIASLVACDDDGRVVGHALFSEVRVEGERPGRLASLAPLAVRSVLQRRGIGRALVVAGLEACSSAGYRGVIVVGHPRYYRRFGFAAAAVAHLASPYAGPAFMGLDLASGAIARLLGTVVYPDAFESVTGRPKL